MATRTDSAGTWLGTVSLVILAVCAGIDFHFGRCEHIVLHAGGVAGWAMYFFVKLCRKNIC